jgi:60 kDa SS-A/Ro ribonucleoprotein
MTIMANKTLFVATRGRQPPAVNTVNREGAGAYDYIAAHKLAQYAATGCLSNTFYAGAEEQLEAVLKLALQLEPEFLAKAAVHARRKGHMKDVPALLLAVLSTRSTGLLRKTFPHVVDNGRMLRNFVQIMRSGVVGRKSLGSVPRALVRTWLENASDRALIDASVGTSPSLPDVVRLVHPKPADASREAFYGWLLGKPHLFERLPQALQALKLFELDRSREVPDVPFQMLTALDLNAQAWAQVALRGGWHMLRMNLNTFARHGVFSLPHMTDAIAARLSDRQAIKRARVLPYQLLIAHSTIGRKVPEVVRKALETAMEIALENVPSFRGRVVVCPDVSGSMVTPITGYRGSATSAVRCIDVAALMAAAVMRANPDTMVLPFAEAVREVRLDPYAKVMVNAERLASLGGGGTNCSAPLEWLWRGQIEAELIIMVSDNQSWVDASRHGAARTMKMWSMFRQRNPEAKLVCIDLQPYGTTQAADGIDVLNVGGFSDEVFEIVRLFARDELGARNWLEQIENVQV